MRVLALCLVVLSGCALLKGEEIECTWKLAATPLVVSGCLAESWDGKTAVHLGPCADMAGAADVTDGGAPH